MKSGDCLGGENKENKGNKGKRGINDRNQYTNVKMFLLLYLYVYKDVVFRTNVAVQILQVWPGSQAKDLSYEF